MTEDLTLEYRVSEEILHRSLRHVHVGTTFGRATMAAIVPVGAFVAFQFSGPIEEGLLGYAIASFSIAGVVILLLYLSAMNQWRARRRLRRWAESHMGESIHWTFTPESFTTTTSERSRKTPWEDVLRITEKADFWLLAIRKGPELFIPVEYLSKEIRRMIRNSTPARGQR